MMVWSQKVKSKLAQMGLSPKRSLGQNFLVNQEVIQKIVDEVKSTKAASLIEIGPGLGALTEHWTQWSGPVHLIELDSHLSKYWSSQGWSVSQEDALKMDWNSWDLPAPICLVSNLPYQISARLVIERSLGPQEISSMVLMFQKEVAQRVVAEPRSENYGLLSVMAQSFWSVYPVVNAHPASFFPKPKVASQVLHFKRCSDSQIEDRADFLVYLKACFSQRRKLLAKNLRSYLAGIDMGTTDLKELLASLGLNPKARAEELSVEDFEKLYSELNQRKH